MALQNAEQERDHLQRRACARCIGTAKRRTRVWCEMVFILQDDPHFVEFLTRTCVCLIFLANGQSLFYYLVSTFCEGHQPRSTHTTKLTLHVMCTNNCTITFCCCCCGVFLFFFFFLCFLVFFFSPCTPCIDVCQCVGVSWLFLFLFLFFVLVFLLSSFYLFGGARPPVDDGSGGGGGNWS